MAATDNTIQGALVVTPDPFYQTSVLKVQRNNKASRLEISASSDAGATYKTILPQPYPTTVPGSVLQLDSSLNAFWGPLKSYNNVTQVISSGGSTGTSFSGNFYADVPYFGTLVTNAVFGFYKAPKDTGVKIVGTQISIQDPQVGTSVIIDIVDSSTGVSLQKLSSVSSQNGTSQTLFSTALSLLPLQSIRLKILQIGDVNPGDSMNVRLMLSPL